jgi:Cytochrome c554 and c-prime
VPVILGEMKLTRMTVDGVVRDRIDYSALPAEDNLASASVRFKNFLPVQISHPLCVALVVTACLSRCVRAQVAGVCLPNKAANSSGEYAVLNMLSDDELRSYLIQHGFGQGEYKVPSPPTPSVHGFGPHSMPAHSKSEPNTAVTPNPNQAPFYYASAQSAAADDPLNAMGPDASAEADRKKRKDESANESYLKQKGVDPHAEVFANGCYPSALQCAKCHQKIYDEWRVSGHAYATVSPMFQRFEQLVQDLTKGTVGTFCMRCHAPVATQMNIPRHESLLAGAHVLREGITCVACHRVVERYGRVNGERRIETGRLVDPIVGNSGGDGVAAVVANAEQWKVTIDPNDKRPRQVIHQAAIQFEQLSNSSFCAGCHQVVVQPGIGLEVVYLQYRSGPAYQKGISCQDCHMGAVPGKALGYTCGPIAEVNEKVYRSDRKHSNHMFHGPGYPIAHPGLFPHNEKSLQWTALQWLEFDYRSGWGTEAFEKSMAASGQRLNFPIVWQNAQDRRDARNVVEANQRLIQVKRQSSAEILANGSAIEGPFFDEAPRARSNLHFHYIVRNTSEGHNMPSGSLGAQPQLWLNAVLIGPDGNRLWESGDLDSNGDLRDLQSEDVNNRRLPADLQLFNMQTKFLITNVKGTEREMALPVNLDIDPIPFFRPGAVPYTVLNHPPFVRMEAHSIPPLDSRKAKYSVPGDLIRQQGRYRLSVRMRSRVEPPYFMRFAKGTPEMLRGMNEGIFDVHPYSVEFEVR